MAFLDFITNRNTPPSPSIERLPADVKAAAVEAARPIAEIAGKGAVPQDAPVQPQATPAPGRGRSLGLER
jgi:hypothetical protein